MLNVLSKRPLIISGPCSAETEEQLISTAVRLAQTGRVNVIRAGIWKPRTHPGGFEGVGVSGLSWLLKAKKLTALPTTVEVATAKHVEYSLQFEVDMLWVGARTTVNPFSMQEVAQALHGVQTPVFVKNPVNPDLELWAGAVERIACCGAKVMGLVLRGFSTFASGEYRNQPMWHLAIEMKRRFPELIMICDPSHICGQRESLQKVIQHSIDLGFDGIMIESHIDPKNAWSDANQQITPALLEQMLNQIIWRKESTPEQAFNIALEKFREQITQLDDYIISLLGQRMSIAEKIGQFKRDNQITILQANRWNEIIARAKKHGEMVGLSTEFISRYMDAVHIESIHHQNQIMNE
ncbi:MAG: bifunctional 3-deoxy-7-phosphoheptulonate synthase/chorismate mutase type II [Oligoflexia bacterium]|nr:bifunctional 3-deoxy-7-phosphoheptulonate synthase/chorismate mutase type II [Oligoflexia bacterium]